MAPIRAVRGGPILALNPRYLIGLQSWPAGELSALRQPLRALLLQTALREPLVNPVKLKLDQVRLRGIEETPSEVEARGVDARQL